MITSRISTNTLHPRQYDCPARTFPQIYELSYFSSVAQLCTTLCDPMDGSTPGLRIEFRARYAGIGDHGSLLPFAGTWASQVALAEKTRLPMHDLRDTVLIPEQVGRAPEEEMATRCSIRAWRIPWTEEPGGLQSVGSQSVEHY